MPRPTPVPVRQAIWRRFQDGQDVPTIAEALGLPPRTVRHLVRRFGRLGRAAVDPSYERCGTATPRYPQAVVEEALAFRRGHPSWGAGLIRVMLRRGRPDDTPPANRTLQRWFVAAGLASAPAGRRPTLVRRRAQRPHEVWQMDAAEKVPLASGCRVSWLRVVDECSGAVLWTVVFPPTRVDEGPAIADPGRTCGGRSNAGGSPSDSGWTTGRRGDRGATCPPTWHCG